MQFKLYPFLGNAKSLVFLFNHPFGFLENTTVQFFQFFSSSFI